jgi:NAD(P)-dependent dehydrogenase (short-subunit alcohol dehydrogenase family)
MNDLKDKIVLITGSGRGIGFAIAEAFAQEGAKIIISDVDEDRANGAAAKLRDTYHIDSEAYKMDVTSHAEIEETFSLVNKKFGQLNVLVNNAGIQIRNPSKDFLEKDWDFLMGVNLKGAFFCCQQAAKFMNGGSIVNISSGTSTQTTPGRAPYVISKAGINAMTAVLASEWAREGIRVNAVAPGWIHTDMVEDGFRLGIVSKKQIFAAVPMKRLASPAEIANTVVFLASDRASYVTGQTLFVDGGWNALGLPDIEL